MPGASTLARVKSPPPTPEPPADDRVAIIHLKGSRDYAAWLEAAYRKTHIAKASIVRLGIAAWAKEYGLEPPPEI